MAQQTDKNEHPRPFDLLEHGLCRVRTERLAHRLIASNTAQRGEHERRRREIWAYDADPKACQKLGVAFWAHLTDRRTAAGKVPPLAKHRMSYSSTFREATSPGGNSLIRMHCLLRRPRP